MEFKNKQIVVVGLGRTGKAVSRFLLQRQAKVIASEKKSREELIQDKEIKILLQDGLIIEAGGHRKKTFEQADMIIISPGVPPLPELENLKAKGKQVMPEIELAYQFCKGKIVGITGSNGKSTTATLTHKILKEGGLRAFLAGNIGFPLINFVDSATPEDVYVVELSSFQLTYIEKFKVDVAVLLNITPDHLDWHPSYEHYQEAKFKLVLSQDEKALTILNQDDPVVWSLQAQKKGEVLAFSLTQEVKKGMYLKGNWLHVNLGHPQKFLNRQEIPLLGSHNLENIMASALVGYYFGVDTSSIRNSILTFSGLEHRLEKVTSIKGITFFNDSKATNIDATLKSLRSFADNIILILGGRDKGGDFRQLIPEIKRRVKAVILLGEAKDKIHQGLQGIIPLYPVSTLNQAVETSYSLASLGDIILLAPGCTSFDMFQNFEERGQKFKEAVLTLKEKVETK